MTQTDNNSYFSLKNPSINNKPQPTTSSVNTSATSTPKVKSGLLNRRQQHAAAATYLQPLELPSLPPLSQLLPIKKEEQQPAANTQVSTDAAAATVAAAVAAGMIPYPTTQQQPKSNAMLFNDFNTNNNTTYPNTTTTTTSSHGPAAAAATTTNMAQLMDPVAAAAAAVAANDFSANLPLDSIYNMPPTVASMDQTVTAAPSSMYLSNYDPNLMQQPPAAALVMQQAPLQPQPQAQQHQQQQRARQLSSSSTSSAEKQYSFVAIPGTNQKKRPRRRYDEIERLYHCTWPGCSKAYGTLNHLNAHVSMQKHVSVV